MIHLFSFPRVGLGEYHERRKEKEKVRRVSHTYLVFRTFFFFEEDVNLILKENNVKTW